MINQQTRALVVGGTQGLGYAIATPLATYLLSPASGVMTGAIINCDQNVSGAYPE